MENSEKLVEAPLQERTWIPFIPSGARIVIERLAEVTEVGGIIIPDQSVEKPKEGLVVALGDGRLIESAGYRIPCSYVLGQRVLIGQHSGFEIEIDSKRYVIVMEDEVLGVNLMPYTPPAVVETPAKAVGHEPAGTIEKEA